MRTGRFWYEAPPQTAVVRDCGAAHTTEFCPENSDPRQPDGSDAAAARGRNLQRP